MIERVVAGARAGWQTMCDDLFRYRFQQTVALETAGEGRGPAAKIVVPDNFAHLRLGVGRADAVAVQHHAALEQAPVLGEQDAMLVRREACEFLIHSVIPIEAVEAEQA